jgi:hypothetical protein
VLDGQKLGTVAGRQEPLQLEGIADGEQIERLLGAGERGLIHDQHLSGQFRL